MAARANKALYRIAEAYCRAVEADGRAHPIQAATACIDTVMRSSPDCRSAADLYAYNVCPFDATGTPLMQSDSIELATWVAMENVYCRGGVHGCSPSNAEPGRVGAFFKPAGGPSNQRRAREVWERVVGTWGAPA